MTTKVHDPLLRDATSKTMEVHLGEILEECDHIVEYCRRLRQTSLSEEERETDEGELYAALTHLQHHIGPALEEWDRVLDALPADD